MRQGVVIGSIVLAATSARAEPSPGWEWGAVPMANYDADAGFGLGAIATLTRRAPDVTPHRASILLQAFITSERVQAHEVRWDVVGVGHPRLRLSGRASYFSTVNSTYCGVGNAVTCATTDAEAAADTAGLAAGTPERDRFVRRYHRMRFVAPSLQAVARWRIDGPLSAFAQWRLHYYRPGTLGERGPYPGSLYAVDHADGEPGLASVPQLGIVYDSRDREGTPGCGMWLEASLRGAAPAIGSRWRFAGANAVGRFYGRLGSRVVAATRVAADVAVGDLPVAELSLINAADTYVGFGGASAGRGVREHRYIGRVKLIAQEELRVDLSARWVAVAFVDLAWVGVALDDAGGEPARILGAGGLGARFVKNQTFILRADLGVSPHEGWAPQLYLYLGHLY